jgi:hypothetical protein
MKIQTASHKVFKITSKKVCDVILYLKHLIIKGMDSIDVSFIDANPT